MQLNTPLEKKLWSVSHDNPLNKETCNQIIDYLLARLSEYLRQPLELVGENWMHETAFSADFIGAIAPRDVFRISYVGTVGMQLIGEDNKPHAMAWLFLFGDKHRLIAAEPDRSFIYLDYERNTDNTGTWKSRGWHIDEFDEFENINEDDYYYKKSVKDKMR